MYHGWWILYKYKTIHILPNGDMEIQSNWWKQRWVKQKENSSILFYWWPRLEYNGWARV